MAISHMNHQNKKFIHGIDLVRTYLVIKYDPVAEIKSVEIPKRKSQIPNT